MSGVHQIYDFVTFRLPYSALCFSFLATAPDLPTADLASGTTHPDLVLPITPNAQASERALTGPGRWPTNLRESGHRRWPTVEADHTRTMSGALVGP
jgi:hypothetical protein